MPINIYSVGMIFLAEVRFASFLSRGLKTMAIINSPERKLTKPNSVQCVNSRGRQILGNEGGKGRIWGFLPPGFLNCLSFERTFISSSPLDFRTFQGY